MLTRRSSGPLPPGRTSRGRRDSPTCERTITALTLRSREAVFTLLCAAPLIACLKVVWRERLHLVGVGALSGLVIGLAAGLGARLVMRVIALAIGSTPVLTEATFQLMGVGWTRGVVTGLLFMAIRGHLRGNELTKGIVFGLLLIVLLDVFFFGGFLQPPPQELVEAPLLGPVLFALLCIVTGIGFVKTVGWLEFYLPAPQLTLVSVIGYGLIMLLAGWSALVVVSLDVVPVVTQLLRAVGLSA